MDLAESAVQYDRSPFKDVLYRPPSFENPLKIIPNSAHSSVCGLFLVHAIVDNVQRSEQFGTMALYKFLTHNVLFICRKRRNEHSALLEFALGMSHRHCFLISPRHTELNARCWG